MKPQRLELPALRSRRPLGSRGLTVGPACVGMVADPEAIAVAFDHGVNAFFVSCDMHWPLYEATRVGLARLFERKGAREEVVVFGCSYLTQPEFAAQPYAELIDAVRGLQRIDVLVAGAAYGADARPRAERLRAHVDRGFADARAVGVSFHERAAAAALLESDCLDALFIRYNAVHPGAFFDFFPAVRTDRTKLVFNFNSTLGYVSEAAADAARIADDVWLPSRADHYRFVLTRPEFDGVLCAPRNADEVRGLVAAFREGPLNAEDENHFIALAEAAGAKARL